MGWVESMIPDKPRDIPETVRDSDTYLGEVDILGDIPDSGVDDPLKSVSGKQPSSTPDWRVTLPDIPTMYRRHIPVLEPDTMTPESADRYVRSRR